MKRLFASVLLCAAALAPNLADARGYHRTYGHYYRLPYPISFEHNYGPGIEPGSFAYYDGPATIFCYQSAVAYIGQDGRRHPCY